MTVGTVTVRRSVDAVSVLTAYLVVLLAIPSVYVVGPLGTIGAPAMLVGFLAFGWWSAGRIHPALGLAAGFQPIRLAYYGFAASVLAAFAWAALHPLPVDQASAADRAVLQLAAWGGIVLLCCDGVGSLARLEQLLRRLVTGGALVAALAGVQYFAKVAVVDAVPWPGLSRSGGALFLTGRNQFTDIRRVSGTAIHPIEFGVVLAMLFYLAIHFAVQDRHLRPLRRWWRVGLIGAAIPMPQSRSAVLALALASLVVLPTWPRAHLVRALKWSPVGLVALRVAFPGLLGTVLHLFTRVRTDPSFTSRTEDYPIVFEFFRRSPILGRGFGTFLPDDFFFLDNQYWMTIVETGLVGLAAAVVLLCTGVATARGARRRFSDPGARALCQALAGCIAGSLIAFWTFDFLSFPMVTGVLLLQLGAAGALWRLARAGQA